jgi:protein-S-isoprenylcysteine O-methyltransferase Ste14
MTTLPDDARTIPVPRSAWMPPQYFLLFAALGAAAHFALGGPVLLRLPWLGAALLVAGAAFAAWGRRTFSAAGTTIKPFERTYELVESGPFRFTRNPMYLGLVTMSTGVALTMGTPGPWLVTLAFALLLRFRFIRNEERALVASLGEPYEQYRRRVRRWI